MLKHIMRLCLAALVGFSPIALASRYNMPEGNTLVSHSIYHLHMTILWICVAIGVVVFGVMLYSIIMHRKSRGAKAAEFHESVTVEIVWTVVPFLILIGMAVPATKVLLQMHDTSSPDLTIKITGYQWKWHYDYIDHGISFFSNLSTPEDQIQNKAPKGKHYLLEVDNKLVLPAGKKIRFLTTANDVIHSWWVPQFGVKKDAIPGFINETWARVEQTGIYRGQCTELCGARHGFMPVVVDVKTPEEFNAWLAEQKKAQAAKAAAANKVWSKAELMKHGEQVYNTACAACHQVNGAGLPGVFPAIKDGKIATGDIKKHLDIVLHGAPGTAMQAFGKQFNDADLAAVITYERNAFGNNTGDVVQPAQVKSAR